MSRAAGHAARLVLVLALGSIPAIGVSFASGLGEAQSPSPTGQPPVPPVGAPAAAPPAASKVAAADASVDSRADLPAGLRTLVDTGHRGEVLALEYDEDRKLLFSAGEDGTVRVWDPARSALVHRLQVTHLPVSMIAIDPSGPRVAVLETDGARSFAISVWDWEQEKRRFRVELAEAPLFLRYSGGGSWLVYGQPRWESLKIVSSESAAPFAFNSEGFGIVSFAEIGPSEKTIMTYHPAGRIAYWDLASGSLVRDLASVPYLGTIRISRDRRYLVGSSGTEVLLVDLLTGAVRARAALAGALSADISPDGGELAFSAGAGASSTLSLWTVAGEALIRRIDAPPFSAAPQASFAATPVMARFGGQELFVASRGGEIHGISAAGERRLLARDDLALITGIAVAQRRIALATSERIWVFSSHLLAGALAPTAAGVASTPSIDVVTVPNPFKATVGLSFLSSDRLQVWPKGEASGAPVTLEVASGSFLGGGGGESRGPFLEVEVQPEGSPLAGALLSLEKSGTVRLTDPATGAIRYESRLPGMSTIALTGSFELAGGRNAAIATEGSLLRIDMKMGETVAIPTRAVFTYEILFDPAVAALYSIGLDAGGSTSLLRHSGRGFENEVPIDRVDQEDLFATLALDSSTGLLFSSLGSSRISVWDTGALALMRFPDTARVPRTLRARDGLLFSLNRDSTVSIWDERGSHLAEISIFTDGEWCFLLADGRFSASSGGALHLEVSSGGSPAPDKDAFRIH
jgi:WD40 repeat protein